MTKQRLIKIKPFIFKFENSIKNRKTMEFDIFPTYTHNKRPFSF